MGERKRTSKRRDIGEGVYVCVKMRNNIGGRIGLAGWLSR